VLPVPGVNCSSSGQWWLAACCNQGRGYCGLFSRCRCWFTCSLLFCSVLCCAVLCCAVLAYVAVSPLASLLNLIIPTWPMAKTPKNTMFPDLQADWDSDLW
jgi:hypothetical protein